MKIVESCIIAWCGCMIVDRLMLFLPIHTDDQINNQIFYNIKRLMDSSHNDNMEILTELIHTEDNLPLFNGVNKKRVCF